MGDVSHKGERHKGQHDGVVDKNIWDRVQAMLGDNTQGKRQRANAKEPSLLAGLLVDEFGNKLSATHTVKGGKRYRYYTSKPLVARGAHNLPVSAYRIPAGEIEPIVVREIIGLLRDAKGLTDALGLEQAKPETIERARSAGTLLASTLEAALPGSRDDLIDEILERVELLDDGIPLHLNRGGLHRRLIGEAGDLTSDPIMITVTARLTRHGMSNRLVVDGEAPRPGGVSNEPLIRAMACGRAWFEELASGQVASFGEIAERVGVTDRYVSRIVDLAFLAPDMVEAMLNGEQRAEVSVKSLSVDATLPLTWDEQRRTLLV